MDSMEQAFAGHEDAWIAFKRAYTLQMRGHLDEALEEYRRSIAAHPTAEAYTFLGWTHSFQGELELAIECCKKAIDTDPDFGNPYNDIGAYLLQLGRPMEAVEWFQKATRAPRYEALHFPYANLGAAYEAMDERVRAMDCYRHALRIEPNHQFSRQRLACLVGEMN